MLWECLTQSSFLQSFPTLYLLKHCRNGSPIYPRIDGRITADLPTASCFYCLIPIHFFRCVFLNSTCATTSSKSNCKSFDLTDSNKIQQQGCKRTTRKHIERVGFDIDLACLKIYHPAPYLEGDGRGRAEQ